jgi:hypothetical protein
MNYSVDMTKTTQTPHTCISKKARMASIVPFRESIKHSVDLLRLPWQDHFQQKSSQSDIQRQVVECEAV